MTGVGICWKDQIDEECNQMMDRLAEQMKERQGVMEELKM